VIGGARQLQAGGAVADADHVQLADEQEGAYSYGWAHRMTGQSRHHGITARGGMTGAVSGARKLARSLARLPVGYRITRYRECAIAMAPSMLDGALVGAPN